MVVPYMQVMLGSNVAGMTVSQKPVKWMPQIDITSFSSLPKCGSLLFEGCCESRVPTCTYILSAME